MSNEKPYSQMREHARSSLKRLHCKGGMEVVSKAARKYGVEILDISETYSEKNRCAYCVGVSAASEDALNRWLTADMDGPPFPPGSLLHWGYAE